MIAKDAVTCDYIVMKKWLFRIVWIPVFVLAVLFLVANRQFVAISLDPFSASEPAVTTPALPLWLWLMLMLFIGFAFGIFGAWLSARPARMKARQEHKELVTVRRELKAAKADLAAARENSVAARDAEPPLLEAKGAA